MSCRARGSDHARCTATAQRVTTGLASCECPLNHRPVRRAGRQWARVIARAAAHLRTRRQLALYASAAFEAEDAGAAPMRPSMEDGPGNPVALR